MNRIFWNLLAIPFPWLVLLCYDNPGGALAALIMQATIIGWIPATIWARREVREYFNEVKSYNLHKSNDK